VPDALGYVVLSNIDSIYGGNGSDKFPGAWAASNAPETNFLQLIMRSLSENGRAAVIVPEGVLFRGGAEKSVRERLLDRYNIQCILVLPENSFHPYAGVDANVLFFERDSSGTEEVWYCDMRPNTESIKGSNPLTVDHFDDFTNNFSTKEGDRFFKVPRKEIENKNYDMNYNQYREYSLSSHRPPSEIANDIREEVAELDKQVDQLIEEK
jgi:type I restriction enzyme M protein